MKTKNTSQTFFKYLKNIMCIFLICIAGFCIGTVFSIFADAESLDVEHISMDFTTIIYGTDSKTGKPCEIDKLYADENRIWVSSKNIPQNLKNAFIAIEDERFYSHGGFDTKRLTGAVLNVFVKGNSSYGGSTITQQLVKNLTGDNEHTVTRKIQEMYRAVRLEHAMNKDEILELYLNTIYLGHQCNGVQAAANTYFGKDASKLTLAECASIAGITQYPSKYDPIINPSENKNKQKLVLAKMLELKYITQSEYDKAINEKLKIVNKSESQSKSSAHSYFVDAVIDDVLDDLQNEKGYSKQIAQKMIYSGGLKIYTTADADIQNRMEKVYEDEKLFAGQKQAPESAMVVIDPYTGYVVGLVGGRGEKQGDRTLNRATQTLRQPGSSIKPIGVYAPAIEDGQINVNTNIADSQITIDGWTPKNSDGKFHGTVSVRTAVAKSLNIPAVKILQKLGVNESFDFMTKKLCISTLVSERKAENGDIYTDKNLSSLALGGLTDGVTVYEMCAAYQPFVNKGIYTRPTTYTKVCDYNGKVILDHTHPKTHIAMSEQTAYLMTELLQGVVSYGTGTGARLSNMPSAGKTGTTTDDKDRWFIGYTPYYIGAVWVGYDTPQSLGGIPGNPAVNIWNMVMSDVHKDKEYKKFDSILSDSGLTAVNICSVSGKRATSGCANYVGGYVVQTEYFREGEIPTQYCSIHHSYTVCAESGKLANKGCPETETVGALGIGDSGKGYISSQRCDLHSNEPIKHDEHEDNIKDDNQEEIQKTKEDDN